jgi:uncharacterized Rossmann fold enzyme
MADFELLILPSHGDSRGRLTVQESALPFPVVRTFWITGAGGQTRGGHRHHKTRQALVAVTGAVSVYMEDGARSDTIVLDSPEKCLIVEPKDWHTMSFGPGSVLLVMASHAYERSDYIEARYE